MKQWVLTFLLTYNIFRMIDKKMAIKASPNIGLGVNWTTHYSVTTYRCFGHVNVAKVTGSRLTTVVFLHDDKANGRACFQWCKRHDVRWSASGKERKTLSPVNDEFANGYRGTNTYYAQHSDIFCLLSEPLQQCFLTIQPHTSPYLHIITRFIFDRDYTQR